MLPHRDPVLYFIERLRDEAHRFAIGSHRVRRKQGDAPQSAGRDRRHRPGAQTRAAPPFRDGESGKRAGVEDLMTVEGISQSMAEAIYGHFHEEVS